MIKTTVTKVYKGNVDLRDYTIKKAYNSNQSIEVTVEGMEGRMMLTPKQLKENYVAISELMTSKFDKNKQYKLISYKWNPDV